MILVLAHAGDRGAAAVCGSLRSAHGPEAVRLVTGAELVLAPFWLHRVGNDGDRTIIRLPDGTELDSTSIGAVLNRMDHIRLSQFESADPEDRDFATSEVQALLMSWLQSLTCPVIQAAGEDGTLGPVRTQTGWLWLASRVGLPVRKLALADNPDRIREEENEDPEQGIGDRPRRYVVAGEEIVGPCPGGWEEATLLLARQSGHAVLGVIYERPYNGGRIMSPQVIEIDPEPPLNRPEEIGAVASFLQGLAANRGAA